MRDIDSERKWLAEQVRIKEALNPSMDTAGFLHYVIDSDIEQRYGELLDELEDWHKFDEVKKALVAEIRNESERRRVLLEKVMKWCQDSVRHCFWSELDQAELIAAIGAEIGAVSVDTEKEE